LLLDLFLIVACAQAPRDDITYSAEQIIPLLRRYDLDGSAKLVNKTNISSKEVKIDLGASLWQEFPFTRLMVADHYLALWSSKDEAWFTYFPFELPSVNKLTAARTLHELVELLAPAGNPDNLKLRYLMQIPVVMESLEHEKGAFGTQLRAAYLFNDRLVWIWCGIKYSKSDTPRSLHTPFLESAVSISISPKFK